METNLQVRNVDEFYLLIDPDTNYWEIVTDHSQIKECREEYTRKMREQLQQKVQKRSEKVGLEHLEIHPTYDCNLACKHCFVEPEEAKKSNVLSYEKMEAIINKFLSYRERQNNGATVKPGVAFVGGEPLIAKEQIFDIIRTFEGEVNFVIQSNGILLTEDDIDFIKSHHVHIGISYDGGRKIHEKFRLDSQGNSHYDRILENIKRLKDYKGFNLITTLHKYNLSTLESIIDFCYSHNIRSLMVNPIFPDNKNALRMVPNQDKLFQAYKQGIEKIIERNRKQETSLTIGNIESYLLNILTGKMRSMRCRMSPCGAGRLSVVVGPSGETYPCTGFVNYPEWALGNFLDKEIEDLLWSNTAKEVRSRSVDEIPGCKECPYKSICCASCQIHPYDLYRDRFRRSFYCIFRLKLIDYLFEVIVREGPMDALELLAPQQKKLLEKKGKILT